jgi:hypothetical protein
MSLPPSTTSFPPTAFHPEPLLAVACPTCFGAIAVGTTLLGQAAECPLCGCGFQVPLPAVADAQRPPASSARTPAAQPSDHPHPQPRDGKREPAAPREPPPERVNQPVPEDAFDSPQPQPAPAAEMHFEEPVRTIISGEQLITLRRLTPAEKASRRARRNVVMMLAGVSILMGIVFLFGTKRPKRRG